MYLRRKRQEQDRRFIQSPSRSFFEGPPLSKPFLWSLSRTEMWNTFNRYEKRSIWGIRLRFLFMPGKERGNQNSDAICNHASWFLNAANLILMQAKPSCTNSSLDQVPSSSSSSLSLLFVHILVSNDSEVRATFWGVSTARHSRGRGAVDSSRMNSVFFVRSRQSQCCQAVGGTLRKDTWAVTHLSATLSEPAVGHRAHHCGSTRKDTFSAAEFNCISGKTEDKSNHLLVQTFIWVAALEILSHIWQDSCTPVGKNPVLLTQGFTRIINHKANPSGAERMQPGQGYVKFLFYQKV